jgi:hypothetical protein
LEKSTFLSYVLTNVETNLASANLDLMRAYAALVTDPEIRTRFTETITAEFDLTKDLLAELFDGSMADRRPRMAKTLGIREAPLKVLHHQQIALLREWRDLIEKDNQTAADALLPKLLLSRRLAPKGPPHSSSSCLIRSKRPRASDPTRKGGDGRTGVEALSSCVTEAAVISSKSGISSKSTGSSGASATSSSLSSITMVRMGG